MPYKIKKSGSGYKVCKKKGGKCFSKKKLSKSKAKAQMRAILVNTRESCTMSLKNIINQILNEN
jgi:hypothetical protein